MHKLTQIVFLTNTFRLHMYIWPDLQTVLVKSLSAAWTYSAGYFGNCQPTCADRTVVHSGGSRIFKRGFLKISIAK